MYSLDPVDDIQSHMLGVITGLMSSYNLNPVQVQARYEYIMSLSDNEITHSYQEPNVQEPIVEEQTTLNFESLKPIANSKSWADYSDEDNYIEDENSSEDTEDLTSDDQDSSPLFVSTRKQFCATMQKGIKICPRYSTCCDTECKSFHVKDEHICQHVTRGSYCDNNECELIVIRACRKGNKCKDSECSFRHR